jgi:hypothetical protein
MEDARNLSGSSEAPLISKALKLVSFAIVVAVIVLAISAAYSGYEEYGALTSVISSSSSGTPQEQLSASINGSELTLSGLQVPNRMTFPLSLGFLGSVSLDNISIGSFNSGNSVIQPGETHNVSVNAALNFSQLLTNSKALGGVLFNESTLDVNTTIVANMVPLVGINLTKIANTTIGPLLGQLQVSLEADQAQITDAGLYLEVPAAIIWTNDSPFGLNGLLLNATITSIPGVTSTGNYGSASGQFNLVPGSNSQTLMLKIPTSDFSKNNVGLAHGLYTIQLSFSVPGFTSSSGVVSEKVSV